jgi:hypothetical protein
LVKVVNLISKKESSDGLSDTDMEKIYSAISEKGED